MLRTGPEQISSECQAVVIHRDADIFQVRAFPPSVFWLWEFAEEAILLLWSLCFRH